VMGSCRGLRVGGGSDGKAQWAMVGARKQWSGAGGAGSDVGVMGTYRGLWAGRGNDGEAYRGR